VYVTPGIPVVTRDRSPGAPETLFQPTAATLIFGSRYAVLVDTFMTVQQATGLADWVEQTGKKLRTIFITQGQGDHWFGAATLLRRFPDTTLVATPHTVKTMRLNASPEVLAGWKHAFPGQIPSDLIIATELEGEVIDLEGEELRVVDIGHTHTDHATCLHVPSIGLVVAGEAVYNGVHFSLAESNARTRHKWLAALDRIEALEPRAVVARHKRPENEDHPRIIEETRQYIRDFERVAASTTSAQELYDKMLELYPGRMSGFP